MSDRERVMEILAVSPEDLFRCPQCGRKFYIDLNTRGATVEFRDSMKEQFRNKAICKDCSGISWLGETFL